MTPCRRFRRKRAEVLVLQKVVLRRILANKRLDRLIFQKFDVFYRMGGDEAVLAYHDGQSYIWMLRNGHGLEIVVVGFLVVFCIDLDPAGIPGVHGVGVVIVDIDGAGQCAADTGQRDGQAGGRGHMQQLPHEGEAR